MINLTEEDKDIIRHLGYPKIVNLSIGSFLIKADYQNRSLYELIGQKLADIMGLICPRYFIVEVDNEKYLLSKDLNQYGTFTPAWDLLAKIDDDLESYSLKKLYQDETWYDVDATKILHGNSIYDIWTYFEKNYPFQVSQKLMNEVLKLYIFDILFMNYDRDARNWGLLTQANKQVNVVILDNEFIFSKKEKEKELNESSYLETVALNVNFLEEHSPINEDFKAFLKESSSEYTKLFKYYFDLITPEFLKGIIDQIEQNNGNKIDSKEEIIEIYASHRKTLLEIYEELITREAKNNR